MNAKQTASPPANNVKPIIRCMEGNHVFRDSEKPCDCRAMLSLRKAMEVKPYKDTEFCVHGVDLDKRCGHCERDSGSAA